MVVGRFRLVLVSLVALIGISLAACGSAPQSPQEQSSGTDAAPSQQGDSPSEQIKWQFSTWSTPTSAWLKGVQEWAEIMERESGGRFTVEIHYNEALGPAAEQIDGISVGLFEAGTVTPFYTPGKLPLNQVMDLPFLPPMEIEELIRFQAALWEHPDLVAELEQWNAVPLLPTALPQYQVMGRKRIATAEDFRGVRITGMSAEMGEVFAEFGAVPTPMPSSEIFSMLERGTVDSVLLPYAYSYGTLSLYEVSQYLTLNVAAGSPAAFVVANKDAWDALPDDIKAIHQRIYDQWPEIASKYFREGDEQWEPIFMESLEVTYLPQEEREKLVAVATRVWDQWVEQWKDRGPTAEILDYALEKRKEIAGY